VRVRPDVINHVAGFICDVKTTQDASPRGFRSAVYKYNYHLQAAFYMDMLGVDEFKFVTCEVNHPYTVVVHTLDDDKHYSLIFLLNHLQILNHDCGKYHYYLFLFS
jgi:hypothetical protein